jgi:hypothetical protein
LDTRIGFIRAGCEGYIARYGTGEEIPMGRGCNYKSFSEKELAQISHIHGQAENKKNIFRRVGPKRVANGLYVQKTLLYLGEIPDSQRKSRNKSVKILNE